MIDITRLSSHYNIRILDESDMDRIEDVDDLIKSLTVMYDLVETLKELKKEIES